MLMSQLPGTVTLHENQDGYIDFCHDGGAPSSRNFPNMFFFHGRRTSDVTLNQRTLKMMGDFYNENIPGILAWVTAVDASQPDVVHDFQLFRDIYAFLDHTNPLVYPELPTDIIPGLMGSWSTPLDYNGTYVGYHLTNSLAEEEYSGNGFPEVKRLEFHPLGTMEGQNEGFMRFCELEAPAMVETVACEETVLAVDSEGDSATSTEPVGSGDSAPAEPADSAAGLIGYSVVTVMTLLFAALFN